MGLIPVPRTLHWFFSLGTARFPASYGLTPDLRQRLLPTFPGARTSLASPGDSEPTPPGTLARSRAATPALLHLLGQPAGLDVRFHLLATEQVRVGSAPHRACLEDAPAWARPALEQAETGDAPLGARDPTTIRHVVRRVLDEVRDGDLVFFDSTNGLRPFIVGLLLSQSVLRAARPGVEVLGAVYGELGAVEIRPAERVPESERVLNRGKDAAAISPLYDLTEFIDLPLWASAADDLRRRFDGRSLSERLRDRHGELAGHLEHLAALLDLGWPEDLAEPLGEVAAQLDAVTGLSPGRRAVLDLAREGLDDLRGLVPSGDELDEDRVRFHVDIARFLARAGRFGDAIRLVREAVVNWALVARGGGDPVADWKELRVRREAERALFRAEEPVAGLWKEISRLRNAASHGRLTADLGVAPGDFVDALARGDGPLLASVDSLLSGDHDGALPRDPGFEVAWLVESGFTGPVAAAVKAIRGFGPGLRLPLDLDDESSPAEGALEIGPAGKVRGANWAARKAGKVRGASDAVLSLPSCPGSLALLARALLDENIRPWALEGRRLWPLFDASMVG